jgi:hypothetical protein
VPGAVEIKSVISAHSEMNLSLQVGTDGGPVRLQALDDVVVVAPVSGNRRIDGACGAVEEWLRAAVGGARREDPFERCDLAAIQNRDRNSS